MLKACENFQTLDDAGREKLIESGKTYQPLFA
jgi:hypothetical protein